MSGLGDGVEEISMKRAWKAVLVTGALSGVSCGGEPPSYGPYWTYTSVVPVFVAKQNSLSTSFNGRIHPETHFVFGAAEGFTLDKPNARLTINANTVWQYAPVTVNLFDGTRDGIGTPAALVAHWEVPPPPLNGQIAFVNSQSLMGRRPLWAVVDFHDFSGTCILEILGHD
jgi:hypothetical protein